MSSLRADGHVHIYEVYDRRQVVKAAIENLDRACSSAASNEARAIFLTERLGCDFFPAFGSETLGDAAVKNVSGVWVFAGRQIATLERMEVLALCCSNKFEDGLPIGVSLQQARAVGAIPVIPWSPGKWMFSRHNLLRELIRNAQPGDFLLADSSLRPRGFPEPNLFQLARERGIGIIAGSDPLPFAGQENVIGTFGFRLQSGFEPSAPLDSVRKALVCRSPHVEIIGRRSMLPTVVTRLYKNKMASS